jgi:hypothetical protein
VSSAATDAESRAQPEHRLSAVTSNDSAARTRRHILARGRSDVTLQNACRDGLYLSILAVAGLILGTSSALAEMPPPDPGSIVTLQVENDWFAHTDRDYTSGLRLGWTSPNVDAKGEDYLPAAMTDLANHVWGEGRSRISFDVSNSIFTPTDTTRTTPDPKDRPYAGMLQGSAFLMTDSATTRSLLGVSLGVLGPSARGEDIQNGWHDIIGDPDSQGWRHQIRDMPVVQAFAGRTWRYGLMPVPGTGLDVDILPSLYAGIGTLRDYGQAAVQVRFGQGLRSDFGTSRIRPGLSGSDAYTPARDFVWYFFAGVDGQIVAWDATLDGNPFHPGPHVSRQPFVAEIEAGLAIIWHGVRMTYTHVAQTQEFYGQRGGLFQFGSLAAAVRF